VDWNSGKALPTVQMIHEEEQEGEQGKENKPPHSKAVDVGEFDIHRILPSFSIPIPLNLISLLLPFFATPHPSS
jgi:hypothetical protein